MPIFLERDSELALLDHLLELAVQGTGALALIEGPAGIGKSRLIEATARRAAGSGLRVLRARGAELERELGFGVARQLLRPALLDTDHTRGTPGHGPGAGVRAVLDPVPGAASDQAAAVDALYWAVHDLARDAPGTLLVVDDAQWVDAPTLRLLVRLAVGLDDLGAALVVAVRSGEPDPDGLITRLGAHPGARLVSPATLTDDAVATLVRSALGDRTAPELCRACAVATGGNPFLVSELTASLKAEGVPPTADAVAALAGMVPAAVVRSVRVRLARLPAAARALAETATVLGPDAPLRHAATVAGIDAAAAGVAADALVGAGILRSADPVLFHHPLIADAIAAALSEMARGRSHRRAAEALAAEGARPERIAAHLRRTPPGADPWVVDTLRGAAADALSRGEARSAAGLLARALDEPPLPELRPGLLRDLARAEAAAGSPAALERLALAHGDDEDVHEHARTLQAMSRLLFSRGEVAAAVDAAERGRSALAPDDQLAGRILASQIASMFFLPGAWEQTHRLAAELESGLDAGLWRPEPLLLAQLSTLRGVWLAEGPARVRPLAERMLSAVPDVREVWQGDPSLAAALVFVGEHVLADRVLVRMAQHAHRTGSPIYANMTAQWRGTLRLQQGWVADAAQDAQRVIDAAPLGWTSETGWSATVLALARLELEDLAGAHEAVAIGMRGDHGLLPHGFVLHAAGAVALAAGDAATAVRHFTGAGTHLRGRFALENPAVVPWQAGVAAALRALGDPAAATAAGEHLAAARATAVPYAVGLALRVAADCADDPDERLATLQEAIDLLGPSGAQLEHARALCDVGTTLRHAREVGAAREALTSALGLAERLGATATARRSRRELQLTGLRAARRGAGEQATALTPAERRVAELAALDHSNAQIARMLFVTQRTVESHLTQTYRKLGIRSRVGLARALTDT
ncbi:hypothetical protein DSM112329_04655 [Paraconexibacter sp. AEG42_29]|uniref:HTH luxR-type domain-containing protein n=1 Tax=Paraconexibacter sp. AEG42_29 TaxID=2997339 RepID=A0AAU7B183_9ACTN